MEQETYPAGTLCWTVMVTPDATRTAAFYSGLFGWQAADASAGFASLQLGGREVAGLLQLPEATGAAEASSRWLVYLASDDIGRHLAKVEAAGGRILAPAFDVPGAGRMAVVSDPVGAEFGLWEGWGHPGAGVMGDPGSLTWAELYTRSRAAAARFYSAVFDWAVEEVRAGQETFITCSIDGKSVAGMMKMSAAWGDTPSHWMPYFAVTDVDEAVTLADGLGGETVAAPHDTSAGRLAVLRDPLGALLIVVVEQPG
ncbi:MAG: VOC family protein [Egibacteraceae bacterium]